MTTITGARSGEFVAGSVVNSRYRVLSVLGRGGVSTVYLAEDKALGRQVALKVISDTYGETDEAAAIRRDAEVRLIASFHHPALVTLYDFVANVENDGSPGSMLVLQYVDGETLAQRLSSGPLSMQLTAEVGAAVASALAHVHDRGVVHRDVKPANILMPRVVGSHEEVAVLADFGIARLVDEPGVTSTGIIIGTANYLSPEQARGEMAGPPSDVYSLGLVLLECLTGVVAFPGTALETVAARLSSDPPIPPELRADWGLLLGAMLNRDPDLRPSAREVERALATIAQNEPAEATLELPRTSAAVLTAADTGPAADTQPLQPTTALRPRQAAEARRARRGGWILAIAAALIALVLLATQLPRLVGQAADPSPSVTQSQQSPPAYPVVAGSLGIRLGELQQSVSALEDPDAASALQSAVLSLTQLAAGGDYEGALVSLDAVQSAADGAQLSAKEQTAIQSAIDAVRTELQALIDAETTDETGQTVDNSGGGGGGPPADKGEGKGKGKNK